MFPAEGVTDGTVGPEIVAWSLEVCERSIQDLENSQKIRIIRQTPVIGSVPADDGDEMFDRAFRIKDTDPNEAARLWRIIAARGDRDAAHNLGMLLASTAPDEALGWLRKAADDGNADSVLALASLLEDLGRLDEVVEVLEPLALSDDPQAGGVAFNLGQVRLRQGRADEAISWWRQAAQSAETEIVPVAAHNLGVALREVNPAEAREWFQRAANAGHPGSAVNLAEMSEEPDGEAVRWLLDAIMAGEADIAVRAAHRLGRDFGGNQLREALQVLIQAAGRAEAGGDKRRAGMLRLSQGVLLRELGRWEQCLLPLQAAAELYEEISDLEAEMRARGHLLIALNPRRPQEAQQQIIRMTEISAELAASSQDHQAEGERNLLLARLLEEQEGEREE
ncbi:tetratricopeptide repeat protein [Nonomuraea sp. MTCD27]|uniref:tetratricopeptide repeat protein n=1 Tax=Nonomuraea sp. MTCD27 TaxID=1676747 RepID=UPI0035BF4966